MKKLETARALLDGWLVYYNFFRLHEALGDKTPAEAAGIKFPFKNWLDVVKSQLPPASPLLGNKDTTTVIIPIASPVYSYRKRPAVKRRVKKKRSKSPNIPTLSTIRRLK
jgi:hypothetical protein